MGAPAWKSLPSWYLVAENDEVIPPDAERQFAQRMGADTIEVVSGHCAMVFPGGDACADRDRGGRCRRARVAQFWRLGQLAKVFTKLDITSRNQLARVPPSHLNTGQIGDCGVGRRPLFKRRNRDMLA